MEPEAKRSVKDSPMKTVSDIVKALEDLVADTDAIKKSIGDLRNNFTSLNRAIIGDSEYQIKGIIAHGKESEERIGTLEERSMERHAKILERIEHIEGTYKYLSGAAFVVGILLTFLGSWVKGFVAK